MVIFLNVNIYKSEIIQIQILLNVEMMKNMKINKFPVISISNFESWFICLYWWIFFIVVLNAENENTFNQHNKERLLDNEIDLFRWILERPTEWIKTKRDSKFDIIKLKVKIFMLLKKTKNVHLHMWNCNIYRFSPFVIFNQQYSN